MSSEKYLKDALKQLANLAFSVIFLFILIFPVLNRIISRVYVNYLFILPSPTSFLIDLMNNLRPYADSLILKFFSCAALLGILEVSFVKNHHFTSGLYMKTAQGIQLLILLALVSIILPVIKGALL